MLILAKYIYKEWMKIAEIIFTKLCQGGCCGIKNNEDPYVATSEVWNFQIFANL